MTSSGPHLFQPSPSPQSQPNQSSGRFEPPGHSLALSRRALLLAGAVAAAGTAFPTARPATAGTTDDQFAQMRAQWRRLWVAEEDYDPTDPAIAALLSRLTTEAEQFWSTMDRSDGRTYLWEDAQLDVNLSFAISVSFHRLRQMALAWATRGTGLFGNAELLADVVAGYDWMVANYYREDGEIIGNWYEWQISGPQVFNDGVALLYDRLTADQVDAYTRAVAHYTPEPFGTAANRVLTSNVVVGWGTLAGNADAVQSGVDGLAPVFQYVTRGDGFYPDGSFIQHGIYPYAGSYGASILDALVPVLAIVANSPWQVDVSVAYAWLRDAYDPVIWRGALMDMVSGRTISRYDEGEHFHGHYVLQAALGLLASAPPDQEAWLRSVLKEWLVSDTFDDPTPWRNIPIVLAARRLAADESVRPRGELVLSKVFHYQDRIVHRRPDWALGIAMSSTRIGRYESINDENLKGWFTADGATYLYAYDSGRMVNGFWPTIDPYRIPGTTVDVRSRELGEGGNQAAPTAWAGGACLAGRFTAGGMDTAVHGGSLTLRKSWMCFDDEVVALGAGITAHDGLRIETIVENRRLSDPGDEVVRVNGQQPVPSLGSSATVDNARWLHIEQTGGYVFPEPVRLHLLREARTGKWSDISHHPVWAKDDQLTANYLTAWLDHGVDPSDDTYAYVLLPTASAEETQRYSDQPGTTVVANTASVQAARALAAGVLCANLWGPGEASIVSSTGGVSVVVEEGDTELAIALADPTHLATTLEVGVAVTGTAVISADPGITVTSLDPVRVSVDFTGTAGATLTVRLTYVPLTVAEVRARLDALHATGQVTTGAYRSLDRQLTAVEEATTRGRPARPLVRAFRRTVVAHPGVSESAVRTLDDLAQRLFARVPA
ncbi:polysaccharide lyase 8 family protein [Thermasporomyces composti]|jgi:hyaluronate lyase|uniref:Hyaluronate lyase n=1 Tax=Thermasporomyces composti TaxID=696763 RepID=A0A3D9V383_THECX|nr:polysaccharide lyase 8 family protein [Thermasporomyces composti]REF34680.1 hyaluronate lyase [Thermasporomyces composti]